MPRSRRRTNVAKVHHHRPSLLIETSDRKGARAAAPSPPANVGSAFSEEAFAGVLSSDALAPIPATAS